MTSGIPDGPQFSRLDLDGFALWLVQRGMRGPPLEEQLAGFCRRDCDAGFPMKRAQLGMGTGAIERGPTEAIRAVIWVSDLRGFTRLTDRLPRDALIEMLDDYSEAMARPLHDNHGQILEFMGDGLLATFDLTARDEDSVCRDALKAAADLRGSFPAFNQARRAAGRPVMEFGLALHLGEVLYGNVGARDRLAFTVVGPEVNGASRIQALCRPLECNVLISSSVQEVARGGPEGLRSLCFHALRGVREPQELFTLVDRS